VASGSIRGGIGMEGGAVCVLFPDAADPQETMKTMGNKGIWDLVKNVEVVISGPLYSNHHRVGPRQTHAEMTDRVGSRQVHAGMTDRLGRRMARIGYNNLSKLR